MQYRPALLEKYSDDLPGSKAGEKIGDLGTEEGICNYEVSEGILVGDHGWKLTPPSQIAAIEYMHTLIAAVNTLSDLVKIPPTNKRNESQYFEAGEIPEQIHKMYNGLWLIYGKLLRDIANWIARSEVPINSDLKNAQLEEIGAEAGVSIGLCKTRTEDLYLSNLATENFLDHPLLEAAAGSLADDDERSDLSEMFRLWGDKTDQFLKKVSQIRKKLEEAKSTTIDSDMHALATWLKEDFKDPSPGWKHPLAPIEGFGDSSINVSMKFYIDNVRMERYLRPFNTFTQFRLRIQERLVNEGIIIPFPQRDLHFKPGEDPFKVSVKLESPGKSVGEVAKSDQQEDASTAADS